MKDHPVGPTFDPGGIYVGALRVGRICFDHRGCRVKILSQSDHSTLVWRRIAGRRGSEEAAISTYSVVYPSRLEVP